MALARLGSGDEVAELFHMLNPINHTRTAADVERYKAEPYVIAGDVYARAPHAGRAGWSWYTGSAAWMYRAGLESMLGLRRRGETFSIDPCIPSSWPGYEIVWRVGRTHVPDFRVEPRPSVSRRLDGLPRRRRQPRREASRLSTTVRRTGCESCWAVPGRRRPSRPRPGHTGCGSPECALLDIDSQRPAAVASRLR